ncbi:transposase DNA-binding-containing protein [Escherichia coli]|uniref:transposase DNA-binding-containing protein n=1 Tax=Escherichia coli TaxID=562 RepID=UPI0030CD8BC2
MLTGLLWSFLIVIHGLISSLVGDAHLGDPCPARRLASLTSSLAQHAGLSIVKSSHFTAQVEGAYRLIRNPSVSP